MKKVSSLLAALALLAPVTSGFAKMPHKARAEAPPSDSLYAAHELQLDLFGTYAFEDAGLFGDDTAGGGIGLNYFITEHFGIGGEGMLFDTDGDMLGSTSFNLFARAPLGQSGLAFYGYVGAGVIFNVDDFDTDDFTDAVDRLKDGDDATDRDDLFFEAHIGGGAEYRFTRNVGVFTDVRHTWVDRDDSDFTSVRAGFRIRF